MGTRPRLVADPSGTHLLGRIDALRLRVAAVVAARRATDAAPDDPFLGLYVSDDHVDGLLAGERPWAASDAANERRREAEAEADAAAESGSHLRLRELRRGFDLDEDDVEVLVAALAPDIDDRFERYYGYLNDDVTRRRASIGLLLRLADIPAASARARRLFDHAAPLLAGGLVEVEDLDRPFLTRALRVPDRVTAHLLGDDGPDGALLMALVDVPPTEEEPSPVLVHTLERADALVFVREPDRTGGFETVVDAASAGGMPSVVLDLERAPSSAELDHFLVAAGREARLRAAVLVAGPVDVLAQTELAALRRLTSLRGRVAVTGHRNWDPGWAHRTPVVVEVPRLGGAARRRLWDSSLGGHDGFDAAAATAQYRLGPGQIRRAAQAAAVAAVSRGDALTAEDVRVGARLQNAARLELLARRIEPALEWDDLVVPTHVRTGLRALAQRARHRDQVLGEWRMRPGGGRGRGITALFAGDSGTGKTMSAEIVAADLGLDLYVVNLATIVDKYIGETEKNLDRVFSEADGVNGVLLFDEADALFGQRSEVRDSHDRYANIEVAYLLQRMESFDGLAILATNLRSNIDEAFARRLDAVVDFPLPDGGLRKVLWGRCLAPLPQAGDLDLDYCASSFELSGGNIRAIAVTAAYRAAAGARPVEMRDLVLAVAEEYRKLGRLCLEAEFGAHFPLLRAPDP